MAKFIRAIQDLFLLIVRVAFGALLILRGWQRWQHQGVQQQLVFLAHFSVPYAKYAAWGAIILELVGGIFLIVGALTPLVALAVVVEQGLTIAYTNFYHRFPVMIDGNLVQGWEYSGILAMVALLLMVFGAGRISVDQLFRRNRSEDDGLPADVG